MANEPAQLPPRSTPLPPRAAPSLTARAGARTQRAARGVREFMRPDRLREFGKTLTLVAPLTMLIWIWAEREQTVGSKESPVKQTFQLAVRSTGVGRAVSLAPGQSNSITVGFAGPSVGLQGMTDLLQKSPADRVITIDVPDTYEPGSANPVPIDPTLLNAQPVFSKNGLFVFTVDPPVVQVFVDRQVEREVPVTLPANIADGVASMNSEPKTIKISGPERTIKQLEAGGTLKADLDIASLADLRRNPEKPLEKIPFRPIDNAPGVTFSKTAADKVTLQLSQEEQGDMPSLIVFISKPGGLNVTATVTPEALTGVRVTGPSDILKQLHDEKITPKPHAVIEVSRDDIGTKGGKRTPTIVDLPPGVRVIPASVGPVTFDVLESTAADDTRPIP